MSSSTINVEENLDAWISQSEAARIRGVSKQAIAKLIARERLSARKIGGRMLVLRSEVEAFTPMPIGRPRKETGPQKAPVKKSAVRKVTPKKTK
ncbi:helix-turn-helix domain-containing protein [Terriglobus tenax]|uniref:helix-turn-helix domain-containing protein n=1 Tax=Terriglobus tenax TaxID=1111115 RepID=UPI0037D9A259